MGPKKSAAPDTKKQPSQVKPVDTKKQPSQVKPVDSKKQPSEVKPVGRAAAKRSPRWLNKLQQCLQSYNCATLGVVMLFCLFLYTLWYISLYVAEKEKRDPLRKAMAQIRRYMITRDEEFGLLNDTDLILEAEKVARELLPWAHKIKEIQAETADLQYKLNHDWVAYNNSIYLFNTRKLYYPDAVANCKKFKAYVADILDDSEEAFLEEIVQSTEAGHWIGLKKIKGTYKWQFSQSEPLKSYWMPGQPKTKQDCVRMPRTCNKTLSCWMTVRCDVLSRSICKKKPEDKWMN
ncbi:oxidized low-density lipoprotein receptor 1-like isoform X2 [Erythrolamprus reginae]|uniref:oxidized low-density lipoprotein receptor 1-like isoform X2 n=1 Tax=Erythrolamprus reginae TaxID=121349 RepID=UPI00396C4B97